MEAIQLLKIMRIYFRLLAVLLCLSTHLTYAQWVDEVKLGVGASFLGTGDVLIAKAEVEAVRNWNRIISSSLALGLGHGDSQWYENEMYSTLSTLNSTAHLDGNLFVSPFGNDRPYHLKIGTGASLMYVRDQFYSNVYGFSQVDDGPEHRLSLGASIILEQEVRIKKRYHIGLKAMIQPYLNGDIANTLLIKVGRIL